MLRNKPTQVFFVMGGLLLASLNQLTAQANDRALTAPVKKGFDNDCPLPPMPNDKRMKRIVKRLAARDGMGVRRFEAASYDLNGDARPEYVVMFGCSAVGNCNWAVFSMHPTKLLGEIYGKDLYFRQRVGQWAAITTYGHLSASWGALTTFCFRHGQYRQCTKQHEVSVEQHNIPRFIYKRPVNCPK